MIHRRVYIIKISGCGSIYVVWFGGCFIVCHVFEEICHLFVSADASLLRCVSVVFLKSTLNPNLHFSITHVSCLIVHDGSSVHFVPKKNAVIFYQNAPHLKFSWPSRYVTPIFFSNKFDLFDSILWPVSIENASHYRS